MGQKKNILKMPFQEDIEKGGEEEAKEKKRTPPIFRKDQHLFTALLFTEIDYYLKYQNESEKIKREHRLLSHDAQDLRFDHIDDYFAVSEAHYVCYTDEYSTNYIFVNILKMSNGVEIKNHLILSRN